MRIFWREAYQDVAVFRVKGLKDWLAVHLHQDTMRADDWPGSFRATHSSPHCVMQCNVHFKTRKTLIYRESAGLCGIMHSAEHASTDNISMLIL